MGFHSPSSVSEHSPWKHPVCIILSILVTINCLTYLAFSRLQNKALVVSNAIMNVFDKGDATAVRKARRLAEDVFGEGWEAKGAGVYDEGPREAQIWGIGEFFFLLCGLY